MERMQTKRAFTLIELLVVVAIIGILAAMLLTALTQAKASAQQTSCLNNLRQLQTAWLMYVHEQRDVFPVNAQGITNYSFNASSTNSWVTGDATYSADVSYIEAGTLYPYVGQPGVYHCPSDQSLIDSGGATRNRSYSLNYYLNGELDAQYTNGLPAGTLSSVVTRYSDVTKPAVVFAFLDENQYTIEDGVYLLFLVPDNTWQNAPSDRHDQGMNLSFTDGHCEHWHWLCPKTMTGLSAPASSPADLQDLRRLQAALVSGP
jgi:prepilin-type N-terminal cleavage/methylation domain-containing protein/prepilin-type processing-associated H-X9-DG protein